MQNRGGDNPRITPSEPALRIILRRLREIMAEPSDGQSRLDKIVRQIAGLMVAEVCSIYLKRQDGSLELFATEGLNPGAVHNTFMKRGEGLVGRCAELAVPINEPDAQNHPSFSYRPETGEEIYHSFLAVPILRGGDVLGVLTVQNKRHKEYSDEDVEVLQTTAMVLAEHLVSGAVAGANAAPEFSRAVGHVVRGQPLSEGLALGHVVLHEARVVVTELESKDPEEENRRLEAAVEELKASIDEMLEQGELAATGEHRDVLEAYRMFAHDRGWLRRMKEAIKRGMTAEAAVERAQNDTRARMLRQSDSYWHERLRDLDELSDRLLRILAGRPRAHAATANLPHDTVLVARTMGAADLLDYDRSRLRGLVLEDFGGQSHVAIVAKALGIAAVGNARGVMERVDQGNPIIVDAESGEVHIRPSSEVIAAYGDKARFRARRHRKYRELARPAGHDQGRPAHRAAHQCRAADGRAASGRVRRRRHRPVPHRAAVHDVGDAAAPRAADRRCTAPWWRRPARSRWCSARSMSAATRCCPTCASRRRRTRRSAGARSASGSIGPACCVPRCARCSGRPPAWSCGCCCPW